MGYRWRVAMLAGVLALVPSSLSSAPALAAPATPAAAEAPATPAPAAGTPSPGSPASLPTTRPAYVRCPIASIPPQRPHPARPVPPSRDPAAPVVGGEGLATTGLAVPPGAPRPPGDLTATSWVVADLDTGAVLAACGPHVQSPPASVQKLLLAATLLPKLDPATVVQVTPADLAIEPGSSAVGLVAGGRYTVATLWLGLLLESGNDAANTLARLGGGATGVPGTLTAMNLLARHLGALDTHAVTPSGLDGPGQFTSAYDLALIARACFARDDFRRYDTALRAQMPAQPPKAKAFQIQNENKLLTRYPGALGGKTGFTDLARHTYVGAAARGGRRLVVTLLSAEALPVRGWQQGASLLDWGFSLPRDAAVGRLVNPGETGAAPAGAHPPAAPLARTASSPPPRHGVLAQSLTPAALGAVGAALVLVVVLLVLGLGRRNTGGPT